MSREIIRMAREAGLIALNVECDPTYTPILGRFAALVLANTPPQSSMAWQEGFEAGAASERDRIKAANAPEIEKVNALLARLAQPAAMQVRPSEFAQLVKGKEALLGLPAYWAEWPNKEQP